LPKYKEKAIGKKGVDNGKDCDTMFALRYAVRLIRVYRLSGKYK